jgi:glutathione synthase/RimK-type ligase-like ATP-grasp enzyme
MVGVSRIPLNVLVGVPDPKKRNVRVSPDGKRLIWRENAPRNTLQMFGGVHLAPHLDGRRFALNCFYLQKQADLRLNFGPGAFLNHIADPDTCAGSLDVATRIVGKLARPCFNGPGAVARTSRDGIARILTGVPGLKVPKTIRLQHAVDSQIRAAIAQAGLEYPVLLRAVGSHGGISLIKADTPEKVEELIRRKRGRKELYATEFRDFKSRDGRYRKYRVVVVGEEILLRHCIIADDWLLHATRRSDGTEEMERAMFARFEREWASQLRPVFRKIATRLQLDLFGVDCNIDEDGRVLLFEANACMNILKNTSPSPNMWDAPIAKIKSAVEERLAAPSTWYGAEGGPSRGEPVATRVPRQLTG